MTKIDDSCFMLGPFITLSLALYFFYHFKLPRLSPEIYGPDVAATRINLGCVLIYTSIRDTTGGIKFWAMLYV